MWLIEEVYLLYISFCIFINKPVKLMSISQCAGMSLNMTCGGFDWLIQIQHESYSYHKVEEKPLTQCNNDVSECTDTEFLNAESTRHCNGKSVCSFIVPYNRFLTACNTNATILTVHYDCIPKVQVFNMCTNFTFHHGYSLYLISPGYPGNRLPKLNCECHIIGQSINGTIIEHEKDGNSPVVMIIMTESATRHINNVKVINTIILTSATKIDILVDNRYSEQTFKLWMGFKGNDMTMKCNAGEPISPTTTKSIVTSDIYSQYANKTQFLTHIYPSMTTGQSDNSGTELETLSQQTGFSTEGNILLPSSDSASKMTTYTSKLTTTTAMSEDWLLTISHTEKIITTNQIKSLLTDGTKSKEFPTASSSSNVFITDDMMYSVTSSSVFLSSLLSSALSSDNSMSSGQPDQFSGSTDNTDLYILIAVCSVLFILLIIIVVLTVFMVRRSRANHWEYNLEGSGIIFAYGSFQNTTTDIDDDIS